MGAKAATLKEPKHDVPVWHKLTMNMDETMAYTGIGRGNPFFA